MAGRFHQWVLHSEVGDSLFETDFRWEGQKGHGASLAPGGIVLLRRVASARLPQR